MPSKALARFKIQISNAEILRRTNSHLKNQDRQIYYHASLATTVAAWDAFVKGITLEFNARVLLYSQSIAYQIIYTALKKQLEEKNRKLNTPNYENARNHILDFTGYDTIPAWNYPRANLNSQQVKDRVGEIFKVRHSFAHGFSIPSLNWTTPPRGGAPRLTALDVEFNEKLFTHLTKITDKNLEHHLTNNFGTSF
ncbi:TPA: hypothetical protein ONB59_001081 [Pseudomonas aeruginosa]|uniref:HEPN domain-containing protein n=1 Tax=Pseudomonas aeruginosa TaxID=287 RepID=UPI000F53F199|nr:HEPN domain-containing protein [Pseudomonas aeruginosa]MBH9359429.1 hypothetical protein [Pseudomonas aeruginosa]HCR1828758.1 hypothetical protein [Pseudomonas aeruginosa]